MSMMTYDEMHDYISKEMKGLTGPDAISKALKVNYHLNQNGAKHLTDDERSKLSQIIMTAIGEPKKQPAVKESTDMNHAKILAAVAKTTGKKIEDCSAVEIRNALLKYSDEHPGEEAAVMAVSKSLPIMQTKMKAVKESADAGDCGALICKMAGKKLEDLTREDARDAIVALVDKNVDLFEPCMDWAKEHFKKELKHLYPVKESKNTPFDLSTANGQLGSFSYHFHNALSDIEFGEVPVERATKYVIRDLMASAKSNNVSAAEMVKLQTGIDKFLADAQKAFERKPKHKRRNESISEFPALSKPKKQPAVKEAASTADFGRVLTGVVSNLDEVKTSILKILGKDINDASKEELRAAIYKHLDKHPGDVNAVMSISKAYHLHNKKAEMKESISEFPALSSLLEQKRVIYKMTIDADAMGFTPMATINKYLKANPDIDIAKEDFTDTVFTAYSKKDLQELFAEFFETPYKELRLGKVSIVKA